MSGNGSSRKITALRAGVPVRIGTLVAVLASMVLGSAAAADAATPGLDVYVGYMDTHTVAQSSSQPNPWPYTDPTRYIGTPCPSFGSTNACWDASALRLVNTGGTDITGVHVVVTMGKTVYDLWGANLTVKAGSDLVLTETGASPNSENFDGSDFSPNAYNGGLEASCANSDAFPVVTVTIGGATTTYTDSGQVLNAGGVDGGHCVNGTFVPGRMDESHPWAKIGTAPAGGGGGGGGGTTATAPSAPAGLKATAGDASVTLTWSAPASDGGSAITGYQVLRGTASGSESALTRVTSTSYTDTGLTNGKAYYYTVVAVNAVGQSAASGESSATPQAVAQPPGGGSGGGSGPPPDPGPAPAPQPPPATAPSVPSALSATAADGVVRLSWAAPSADGGSPVTGYRISRSTVSGGETAIGEVTGTSFTDQGVSNGTTYFYTVAALNAVGPSGQSAEVSATPQGDVPSPSPDPSPSPSVRVCAGLPGCRVVAHADVNGDGHRDVIALARRGGRPGTRGALIVRVKVGPQHIVQTRRLLDSWTGSPWLGVSRLDGRRGTEIVVGRLMGAAASFYQALTWRHGLLVRLDAPGRGQWWSLEHSATLLAGWQRLASDPVGTIRRRIATHGPQPGPYQGTIRAYRWTRTGWRLVQTERVASLPLRRALLWGRFDVPGLRHG